MAQTDYNYKELVATTPIPATVGAVFTNPVNKKTNVSLLTIHNASDTDIQTVKLYKVANATGSVGTAADAGTSAVNRIFRKSISPGDTYIWEFPRDGMLFDAENDTLQAVTDDANTVTITIGGGQETTA